MASEAVEQVFQQHNRKRKRRRGAVDLPTKTATMTTAALMMIISKEGRKAKGTAEDHGPSKQGAGKKEKAASKYRDRTKERRVGDNTDYQDFQRLLAGVAPAAEDGEDDDVELHPSFCLGDEAYTHMVEGLNVILAKQHAGDKRRGTFESWHYRRPWRGRGKRRRHIRQCWRLCTLPYTEWLQWYCH
jgi:hypothetical protein